MKPVVARLAVLSFLGVMCGISFNAIFLQEGRLARFDTDPAAKNIVVKKKDKMRNSPRHVATIRPNAIVNKKIEDVLREFDEETLRESGKASVISAIQNQLREKGYHPGIIDGIAGPTTRAAIMAFEFDNGMKLTGLADQELLGVLVGDKKQRADIDAKHISDQAQELVLALQRALNKLGYDTGSADGIVGPLTRKRIEAFERDHKLKVTGRISGVLVETINKLRGHPIVLAKLD